MSELGRGLIKEPPAVIWVMALIFAGIELSFHLGETGRALENWAFTWFAFTDFWFEVATEGGRVPFAFWLSFFTYAFLHGGLLHLLMNGAIFLSIGGVLANQLGALRFLALFFVSSISGAVLWALMYQGQPLAQLVGASGAIFGFFGALKRWEWLWMRETGAPADRFWKTIIALVIMNIVLAFTGADGAAVAWQAHLGGFIGGWLIAPVLAPGRRAPSPI